jgi:DNA-binding NtrC family response regulator
MTLSLLIVEDDEGLRSSLEKSFRRKGYEVLAASSASETDQILRNRRIDIVLMDMRLPDASGLDLLETVRNLDDEITVIMMTAFPEVKAAVQAMRKGAWDFIVKPFELEELQWAIERVVETRDLRRTVHRLEIERRGRADISEIVGESPVVGELRVQIRKVAGAGTPVLVVGETGTGKELVADSIHRLSSRAPGPLVKVNCSAFSEPLLESELFGHERGAFTDAREARVGLFEMADGGTLFFDEIAEMKPGLQAKLLRVIEGQPFRRVGGQREMHVDVRVLAATNLDLQTRVRAGLFREDLYFRLNVFQMVVPPLRSRGADIGLLARFFLKRSADALRKTVPGLTSRAEEVLMAYPWPGNIRELRNVMERAAILCETGEVGEEHLPRELQLSVFVRHVSQGPGPLPSLDDIKRRYVDYVVKSVGGNLSEAARILGISRNTLRAHGKNLA